MNVCTCICLYTHTCVQKHLCMHTFIYVHSHVLMCPQVCTLIHTYKHVHTPDMQAHTLVPAHVHRSACAQVCTHRAQLCVHTCPCTHTHTHVSARTQMDTCGCVNVCVCSVYTSVCTRASTTLRPAPAGGGRDYLKGPRQWAHAVASARLAHDPTATALPQLSQFRMMGCGRDTFTHLGEWVEDDSMLRGKLRQGWVPSSPCHLVRTDKAPCAPSPRTWRLPQHTASR